MTEWQERVIQEKANLDDKIEKLKSAFSGVEMTQDAYNDLSEQLKHMSAYSDVLGRRISKF